MYSVESVSTTLFAIRAILHGFSNTQKQILRSPVAAARVESTVSSGKNSGSSSKQSPDSPVKRKFVPAQQGLDSGSCEPGPVKARASPLKAQADSSKAQRSPARGLPIKPVIQPNTREQHALSTARRIKLFFARSQSSRDCWRISFDQLRDLQFIGRGGQAKVFAGTLRGERVAFKRVSSIAGNDLRHLRTLNHKNLVRFRGVCVEAPNVGFVMEFCPYGSLHREIYRRDFIRARTAMRWATELAAGMNYLHMHGIVHRDLKPHNILLGNHGALKIADFDTSRKIGKAALPVTFSGTVAYMAPELLRQVSLTFKVDVWAYGVVLWEILNRRTPYANVDALAIIYGVGLNTLRLEIPSDRPRCFQQILASCLQKLPSKRPSFEKILVQLEKAVREAPAEFSRNPLFVEVMRNSPLGEPQ